MKTRLTQNEKIQSLFKNKDAFEIISNIMNKKFISIGKNGEREVGKNKSILLMALLVLIRFSYSSNRPESLGIGLNAGRGS